MRYSPGAGSQSSAAVAFYMNVSWSCGSKNGKNDNETRELVAKRGIAGHQAQ